MGMGIKQLHHLWKSHFIKGDLRDLFATGVDAAVVSNFGKYSGFNTPCNLSNGITNRGKPTHKDQFHIQHIAELSPALPAGSCQ